MLGGWESNAILRMMWAGGWMMWPLAFVGVWVLYLLLLRSLELWQVWWWMNRWITEKPRSGGEVERKMALVEWRMTLMRIPVLTQTLISSAPLMGLLGTVSGMITTFEALADGALHQPSGGIAGGIAQALLTTQLGLSIALPALLWQQLLGRWASRLVYRLGALQITKIAASSR
ncbi:MotA/TolQ/ExbB proton channel family protein [Myxococcota bacterium]|nr:MotA/TolQ/ExbB proton channel family protein [Myxococcota bacterium]